MRLLIIFAIFLVSATQFARGEPSNSTSSRLSEEVIRERALAHRGATQEAAQLLQGLIPKLRSSGDAINLSRALNDLSLLQSGDGNYTEAIRNAREAAALSQKLGDKDGESRALDNLGVAQLFLADYPAAQNSFASELVLVRALKDAQAEVQAANNLGSAYFYQGNYTQALAEYEGASAVLDASTPQPWVSDWRQISDVNIATLYQRLSRFDRALQIYRKVQTSNQKMSAADRAQLFSNLGALYRHLGDSYKALESYHRALQLLRQRNPADEALGVLLNIGTLYALDRGDLTQASAAFRKVLTLAAPAGNRAAAGQAHLYLGEIALRQRRPDEASAEFGAVAASAEKLGIGEDRWQAQYGLGRAAALRGDSAAAERHFRAAIISIESLRSQIHLAALKAEFLAEKRDVYDALIRLLLERNDIPGVFEYLERSRARTFQDRLQSERRASPPAGAPLTLAQTQRHLAEGVLLVEFWTTGDQAAVLWATRGDQDVTYWKISTADQAALSAFLAGLPGSLDQTWRQSMARLQILPQKVLESLRQKNVKHLIIVPDGAFSLVPMELVPLDSGELLIERYDVSYLPSAALLLRPSAAVSAWHVGFPWQQQLAAFGAPALGSTPARSEAQVGVMGEALPLLPGSEREIFGIAHLIAGKAKTYLGNRDLRATFLSGAANAAPLLHVSTHGFADASNPERTRLLFSPAGSTVTADYVFLRELEALDLRLVDMATLSACDTEKGQLIRGEGTQAFSRALLSAGARTSVTTLWRIGDAASAEFMKQFYYYLLVKRQSKAEALRSAKLRLLHSQTALANPQDWAAFVLSGDGQNATPAFLPWFAVILLPGALVLALAAAAWALATLWRQQRIHRRNRLG